MAVPSISCALKPPPVPFKDASGSARPPQVTTTAPAPWSGGGVPSSLRRACVAAAACAVVAGMAPAGGGMAAVARDSAVAAASRADVALAVDAQQRGRWSDSRRCPPWRANSLENFVPENLPRPSPQRRFNGVAAAPALAPDAVAPFLARRSGMGCFSL